MSALDTLTLTWRAVYHVYGRELDDVSLGLLLDALSRWPDGLVVAALRAHMADPEAGKWCPKPADLIPHLRRLQARAQERSDQEQQHALPPPYNPAVKAQLHDLVRELTARAEGR